MSFDGAQRSPCPTVPCPHAYASRPPAGAASSGTMANAETATSLPVRVREWYRIRHTRDAGWIGSPVTCDAQISCPGRPVGSGFGGAYRPPLGDGGSCVVGMSGSALCLLLEQPPTAIVIAASAATVRGHAVIDPPFAGASDIRWVPAQDLPQTGTAPRCPRRAGPDGSGMADLGP
jgi:hypothetical protein